MCRTPWKTFHIFLHVPSGSAKHVKKSAIIRTSESQKAYKLHFLNETDVQTIELATN